MTAVPALSIPSDPKLPFEGRIALVVEDDLTAAQWIRNALGRQQVTCWIADSYEQALDVLKGSNQWHLFILDYFLGPASGTGLELCRLIRSRSNAPVIFLSGQISDEIVAGCLDAGADQFLHKPVGDKVFGAYVHSALRRLPVEEPCGAADQSSTEDSKPDSYLFVDEELGILCCDDQICALSGKELALVKALMDCHPRPVSRDSIAIIGGADGSQLNARYLDNLISRVRKKLRSVSGRYEILTVRNHGYALIHRSGEALS